MSEDDRREALELLRSPDLLGQVLQDFTRCGVVGEETNKLAGYLAAVSRKLDKPLAIVVQSNSAAGKSSLMEAVLAFMPEEDVVAYSAMTGQSLFYMGDTDLKHKILAVAEEEGAQRASYALKLLQSEGVLRIASTGKDAATGRLVTEDYVVEGPVMIFLTTTASDVDEELMNRCLVLSVDEGRRQTEAIHLRQRSRRRVRGRLRKERREAILRRHRNAQRLLGPIWVDNPFVDQLTFQAHQTRFRRDHEKYLTLIEAIAFLHQHQRERKTYEEGGEVLEYIEVQPQDIRLANRLAHEVLGRSLDELPPQTRRFLQELVRMVDERSREQGLVRSDVRFTRREVREWTGAGNSQVAVHLERLQELEYLLVHAGGRGRLMVYELLYEGDAEARAPFFPGLVDLEGSGYDPNLPDLDLDLPDSEAELPGCFRGVSGGFPAGFRGAECAFRSA